MSDTKLAKIKELEFLDDNLYLEAVYVAYGLIDLSEKLFEALISSSFVSDMPYGTMKARDGDPYEWIYQRIVDIFQSEEEYESIFSQRW